MITNMTRWHIDLNVDGRTISLKEKRFGLLARLSCDHSSNQAMGRRRGSDRQRA